MQFGLDWLAQWVKPLPDPKTLAEELPQRGFEVASLGDAGASFNGVVTAELAHAEPHPNADKLRVCRVFDGNEEHRVVCGAPNARAGIKVALAKPGALLPGDFAIKVSTIRGIESHGMLCSARELELGEDHSGIIELPQDTPVGVDFRAHAGLDEQVIELEITPNRGDCFSLLGMAREVAAIFDLPLAQPVISTPATSLTQVRAIHLKAPQACPAYFARVVRLPSAPGAAPEWMQRRLLRAGLRPINLWVDITNFVMLELGQPLHAFDNSKLSGDISVGFAEPGASFTLLNEQTITLRENHLMINDANGPVALGGVMGGADSAVIASTTEVLLEAAHFAPAAIAGRARELKLTSDACFRFERGVDPTLPEHALTRACELLVELAGAELGPICKAVNEQHLPQPGAICVRFPRLNRLAGVEIPREFAATKLKALGFAIEGEESDDWRVTPPPYRLDVELEQDLLEEVLRMYGLTNLPDSLPLIAPELDFAPEANPPQTRAEDHLVALGYQEVISYSFISREEAARFSVEHPVALANPIAETHEVMRPTLLPSLLGALDHNRRRQYRDLKVFEIGLAYYRKDGRIIQPGMLGLAAMGGLRPLHWRDASREVDFFSVKGDLESLFVLFGLHERFDFASLGIQPGLHPGRSAAINRDGEQIGVIGELHPSLCRAYDLGDLRPVLAELRLDALLNASIAAYSGLSRFPGSSRDFAFVLEDRHGYAEIEAVIRQAAGPYLRELTPFDLFTSDGKGASLPAGHHSLAVRLNWVNPEATLSDKQVNHFADQVVTAMHERLQAVQR